MYCFANSSIVFSGSAWLIYRAGCCRSTLSLKMAICRGLWGDFVTSYPQTRLVHFPITGEVRMGCCHCEQRHRCSVSRRLPCGAAVAGRCVQNSDVFVQVESLQCGVNRNQLPGDSLKLNCSGKLAKRAVINRTRVISCDCVDWK